jgi:hypothetical protein
MRFDVLVGPRGRSVAVDEFEAGGRADAQARFRERDARMDYGPDARAVYVDDEDPGPPRRRRNPARARRRRRRNPRSSGLTTFLLAATGVIAVLYIGKKLSQ